MYRTVPVGKEPPRSQAGVGVSQKRRVKNRQPWRGGFKHERVRSGSSKTRAVVVLLKIQDKKRVKKSKDSNSQSGKPKLRPGFKALAGFHTPDVPS